MNRKCNNEVVKGAIDTIKQLTMDFLYNDEAKEDFDTVVAINEILKILEDEIAGIEEDREHQKNIASKLRKLHGETFSAECDAAGIK